MGLPKKGRFKPLNPKKYKGDAKNIIYRSRWESVFMSRLDRDDNVIWWSSEELYVFYKSPVDNLYHRYFPDFLYETKNKKVIMVEIKPLKQTKPPILKEGVKKSNKYIQEYMTWEVNKAKWEAAIKFCESKGIEFHILTEKELGLK